jgi:signal transduction histidine kinase/CheY-like chemotaxis protein
VVGWVVTTGDEIPPDMNLLWHLEGIVVQLSAIAIDRAQADTELSKARDEALNASRLKSAFLATMSHEIRTPMNGIIGMSEVLLSTSLDERQQECLHTIRESADLLVGMINDILDHSKLEANAIRIEEMEFDLHELVEGATSLLAPAAQRKGLELVCEVPVDVDRLLLGDPLRLRQVLLNLLGNAIKFTDSGEIWVEARLEETAMGGATLELGVHDTGIGIPDDRLVSIFESFSQADTSTTRRFGGTGLGLTISKQLVECMGGTLEVQSSVGQGTSFFARIPVNRETAQHSEPKDPFCTFGFDAVVIWKNAQGRSTIRKYLSAMGVGVSDADNLAAYLQRYGSLPPDAVIIADVEMITELHESVDVSARRLVALLPLSSDRLVADQVNAKIVWKPVRFDELRQAIGSFASTSVDTTLLVPADLGFEELHVLVTDDNRTNRRVAGHMLERLGHTVEFAENGEEAVALAATGRFDVVFMDIEMPLMDGVEAMKRIRSSGIGLSLPIYALTAHDSAVAGERVGRAGFDGAVIKPVRGDRLAEILARVSILKAQKNPAA